MPRSGHLLIIAVTASALSIYAVACSMLWRALASSGSLPGHPQLLAWPGADCTVDDTSPKHRNIDPARCAHDAQLLEREVFSFARGERATATWPATKSARKSRMSQMILIIITKLRGRYATQETSLTKPLAMPETHGFQPFTKDFYS